jgi:hypothetical protein
MTKHVTVFVNLKLFPEAGIIGKAYELSKQIILIIG